MSAGLLCRVAGSRPILSTLVAPCVRVVVPVSCASVSAKQRKTTEKYAAKAAKSKKNKGDFLSKKVEDTRKKPTKHITEQPRKAIKAKDATLGLSVEEQTILDDDTNNMIFDYPNMNYTKRRYEEYEEGEQTEAELEPITEQQLQTEREKEIARLWEPYSTEEFNLKALIGDASSVDETSPHLIKEDRPSKMFYYTEDEIKQYLPEGVAGKLKEFERFKFNKKGVLVRPVVEDVISWLENWRERSFMGRVQDKDFYTLLDGPAGSGKSCLLNPLVQWARMSGWLVVFVPDGKDWAGYPKKKEGTRKMLSYSKVNDTWFGQPHIATTWITALLQAHGDKLATLPLRTNFTVRDVDPDKSKFVATPEKTLKDLLEYGLSQPDHASDCVWYLRKELCSVTEYPVLIVVDAVNAMRNHSYYGDPIDPYVFAPNLDTSRLVLNRAFQDFRNHGLINGMYVGTVCNSTSRRPLSVKVPNHDMKRTQYKMDPSIAVTKVPAISRAEAHLLADWYRENSVFTEDIPSQTVDYMWTMAEGNGDEFWRQATFM